MAVLLFGPFPAEHNDKFNMKQMLGSVDAHFLKSVDKTVFDLTGLTPEQLEQILNHIKKFDPAKTIILRQ